MDLPSIVVGSGPAGVACAKALLNRGRPVLMLDAGIDLEDSIRAQVDTLRRKPHRTWTKDDTYFLRNASQPTTSGLGVKTVYGSTYPYDETGLDVPVESHHVQFRPSFAKGGLSTVWGAAILPYSAEDLADWPISLNDLAAHYQAVLQWMPLAGVRDSLDEEWPVYSDHLQPLRPSLQARSLLEGWEGRRETLNSEGVRFGQSRLAVRAEKTNAGQECVYCGLCLHGCPYSCIYSTQETLSEMSGQAGFAYTRDIVVKKVAEDLNRVTVQAVDRRTRQAKQFIGERVYLAGGVLPTTKILLESLGVYDETLTMRTSQHFSVPLLALQSQPDVDREDLHTLAQGFLEIKDKSISPKNIHLQTYTYNDLFLPALRRWGIGYLLAVLPVLKNALLGRLLFIQGYLHSSESATIHVTLEPSKSGGESRLRLEARISPTTKDAFRRLLSKLARLRRSLGFIPLSAFSGLSDPGEGYHNGGTFPMSRDPSRFETDLWGRPAGLHRVHAVDATVFPSIPAATITLSVMANAHRIGSFHD